MSPLGAAACGVGEHDRECWCSLALEGVEIERVHAQNQATLASQEPALPVLFFVGPLLSQAHFRFPK